MGTELSTREKELSRMASAKLGFRAIVYRDGNWMCDPADKRKSMGFGSTPEQAIDDCLKANPANTN